MNTEESKMNDNKGTTHISPKHSKNRNDNEPTANSKSKSYPRNPAENKSDGENR